MKRLLSKKECFLSRYFMPQTCLQLFQVDRKKKRFIQNLRDAFSKIRKKGRQEFFYREKNFLQQKIKQIFLKENFCGCVPMNLKKKRRKIFSSKFPKNKNALEIFFLRFFRKIFF